jgi:carbamoyltransferase
VIVLGLNSVYHESSAALLVDGHIVAAAEEERFTRRKHAKRASVDNAHIMPRESIAFCLAEGGLESTDIDQISYSYDPELRRKSFRVDAMSVPGNWGSCAGEDIFLESLGGIPAAVYDILGASMPISYVRHHLAHAASVYHTSCPKHAAVLVVDGIGESSSTVLFGGAGGQLKVLEEIEYPHSIGFLWEKISTFLGFSEYDACKVMGLAAYGDATIYRRAFSNFVQFDEHKYRMNLNILRFRLPETEPLAKLLGEHRQPGDPIEQRHADIAATLQGITNQIMLNLARYIYRLHPARDLALAGGVALNCTANYLLKERAPFENIHVPLAPHDSGTAIGAALHVSLASSEDWEIQRSPYIGPQFDDDQVCRALRAVPWPAEIPDDLYKRVADLLCAGAIVGWFQGRMEWGPRALGNRSLLADPRNPAMREVLNRKVKHREPFRPFAPSVLVEHADEWFCLGRRSAAYEAMLFAVPVRSNLADRIPAVVHVDGSARIQIVTAEANPRFHQLISCFHARTGVPMVLNTSFNDSEPIVCTPADAVHTFLSTRIDALAIGDRLVRRPEYLAGE